MILQTTAATTGGQCMACKTGIRDELGKARACYAEKQKLERTNESATRVAGKRLQPPALEAEIIQLRRRLPHETPDDYFSLLRRSDGADIWFSEDDTEYQDYDYLQIDSVTQMLKRLEWALGVSGGYPFLLVIGGDGSGQLLSYDMRSVPWPIVMFLPGYSDVHPPTIVASSATVLMELYF
jgi:hypothetical protein